MITPEDLKLIAKAMESKRGDQAALVIVKGGKSFRFDAPEVLDVLYDITYRINSIKIAEKRHPDPSKIIFQDALLHGNT